MTSYYQVCLVAIILGFVLCRGLLLRSRWSACLYSESIAKGTKYFGLALEGAFYSHSNRIPKKKGNFYKKKGGWAKGETGIGQRRNRNISPLSGLLSHQQAIINSVIQQGKVKKTENNTIIGWLSWHNNRNAKAVHRTIQKDHTISC